MFENSYFQQSLPEVPQMPSVGFAEIDFEFRVRYDESRGYSHFQRLAIHS